jgi:site-specific DNA-adenine methylase
MPFAYYGAKHGLASKYPRPTRSLIIEPFAGSAGYACYWARRMPVQVMLCDADEYIVRLWRRLQTMTHAEVDAAIDTALASERTTEPLVAFSGGGSSVAGIVAGYDRKVTPRMYRDGTTLVRRRIHRTLPHIRDWTIIHGTYSDLPDIEATWYIDPPYRPHSSESAQLAGNAYTHGAQRIDYDQLAHWCENRRGQVIVCEQSPADWLPFTTLADQNNGSSRPSVRTEVVWHRDDQTPEQMTLL